MSDGRTLLLFDVDGVLIDPRGYKEALRVTVDHFAAQMDQAPVALTYDEIALFEAINMTNEWVSGAMCVAALMVAAARRQPELVTPTFEETVEAIRQSGVRLPRPDFSGLARHMQRRFPNGVHSSRMVLDYLLDEAPAVLHPILRSLLESVFPPGSATSRIFQHYTLGSAGFEETYQQQATFQTGSFLSQFDRRGLSEQTVQRLLERSERGEMGMAIYTARPSLPPVDLTVDERAGLNMADYPPEGEAAATLLGLEGRIPLIATGRLGWLAGQRGQAADAYIKPSPVHALAAAAAAWSGGERGALLAAAALVEEGKVSGPFAEMGHDEVRLVVFEDSTGGLRSGHQAAEYLRKAGIKARMIGIGVAPEESKRETLATIADRTVDNLEAGLRPYL